MDPIVQQCQLAYEQALSTYDAGNMFEYEKVCKQIFMKSLLNANASAKQETRLQLQKQMNAHFLKFQMKEKDIKKKQQQQEKMVDDQKILRELEVERGVDVHFDLRR